MLFHPVNDREGQRDLFFPRQMTFLQDKVSEVAALGIEHQFAECTHVAICGFYARSAAHSQLAREQVLHLHRQQGDFAGRDKGGSEGRIVGIVSWFHGLDILDLGKRPHAGQVILATAQADFVRTGLAHLLDGHKAPDGTGEGPVSHNQVSHSSCIEVDDGCDGFTTRTIGALNPGMQWKPVHSCLLGRGSLPFTPLRSIAGGAPLPYLLEDWYSRPYP